MKIRTFSAEVAFVFITFLAGVVANISPVGTNEKNVSSGPVSYPSDPPIVLFIQRSDPDPYPPPSSTTIDFDVAFSEDVVNIDINDFALTITGVANPFVANVSGSGDVYVVTVNTGTGNGTIRLDVPVSASIQDLTGKSLSNLPFTKGDVYWIMKTATFEDVLMSYWAWNYIERWYDMMLESRVAVAHHL